jgi:hypothetical protein
MVNQLHRDTNHSARPLIGSINHGVDLQFLRRLRWVGWSLHVFQDGTGWPHSQVLQSGQARDDRVGHADAPGFIGSGTRQRTKGKNGNGTDSRLRGRSGVIVRVAVVLVRGGSAGLAYVNRGGDDHRQGGCDPPLDTGASRIKCGAGGRNPSGLGVAHQTLQIGAHLGGVLIADVSIFLQRFGDDALEVARRSGIQADGRNGLTVQKAVKYFGGSAARGRVRRR